MEVNSTVHFRADPHQPVKLQKHVLIYVLRRLVIQSSEHDQRRKGTRVECSVMTIWDTSEVLWIGI